MILKITKITVGDIKIDILIIIIISRVRLLSKLPSLSVDHVLVVHSSVDYLS